MLTDAHCRAAKPKEQLYRLNDLRGLYLEVKPNGVKAWRYRFKLAGKGSWFALGDYPSVSLADAREKCDEARKLVKQGINPVQNRQVERIKREQDSANTFEVVAKEWLALKDWEEVTKRRRLDMLQRVPLPAQAVEMLRRLRAISGDKTHLFPGRDDRNKPMSAHSIRQALKVLGWSGTYSPHGTRTTGSTRLNEMGYRPDAIEAQLAHAEPNSVRRTYNHATYLDERREMMQAWADKLELWKQEALNGKN